MLRFLILGTALWIGWAGLRSTPVAADDAPGSPVQQLLDQLSSPDYAARQQARRALRATSLEELPDLVDGQADASAEASLMRVRILEEVMLSDAGDRGNVAEQGLEFLSISEGPMAAAAKSALIRNSQLRESRARLAIEKLGGVVTYRNPSAQGTVMVRPPLPDAPGIGVGFGPPAIPASIWLHDNWKGKPEDLWHLRRFSRHSGLVVYIIKQSGVSADDILALASWLPGLSVQERGANFGIKAGMEPDACAIREVTAKGPAEKAGLLAGDRIVMADQTRIRSFFELVDYLTAKHPGDMIDVTAVRANNEGGEVIRCQVRLSSWHGREDPDRVTPPPEFSGPEGASYLLLHDRPPQVPLPEPQQIDGILR